MDKQPPVSRERALEILAGMDQQGQDMLHYIETEAIMRGLAPHFGGNPDYWSIIGLLHDVDWALTKSNQQMHCVEAARMLEKEGFDPEDISVIQSHAYGCEEIPVFSGKERTANIEHALAAAETVSGLIYAYALMRGKKVSDMKVSGLKKKFRDRSFAAGCSREIISGIEKTDMSLDDFLKVALESVQGVKEDIGLG